MFYLYLTKIFIIVTIISFTSLAQTAKNQVQTHKSVSSRYIVFKTNHLCRPFEQFLEVTNASAKDGVSNKKSSSLSTFYSSNGNAIDMKWLTCQDYYAVWDETAVNPYRFQLKYFKDDIRFNFLNIHFPLRMDSLVINSKYGMRRWRWHHGIDVDIELGEDIYAIMDGVIRIAKYDRRGYGYYILVRHSNGLESLYGHLREFTVQVGQEVKAGQVIGKGGSTGRSTGPHLHFETRYRGHAFDPTAIFDLQNNTIATDFTLTKLHFKGLIELTKARFYRIRRGDSLWLISRKFRTSINRICKLNGISRRRSLKVGKKLRIR